jgi:hypothetical protein
MTNEASVMVPRERAKPGVHDLVPICVLLIAGVAARLFFLGVQGLPRFDPWRHLLLVENLRAGRGFTLFAGQPYIWYPPFWHGFAALMPRALGLDQLAALFSLLTIPLAYVFARVGAKMSAVGAGVAGLFMAASGPLVAFTCHYGPEAFALFLILTALCLAVLSPRWIAALTAGVLLSAGIFLRPTLAILAFLFIPFVPRRKNWMAYAAGGAIPAAFVAVWNHRVIAANPFIFTWDGLATQATGYGWLSTLLPQFHPTITESLRQLHSAIMPSPEWFSLGGVIRWDTILFMVFGVIAVVAARRLFWMGGVVIGLVYILFLDRSLSANYFRIALGLFPIFFLSIGALADRVRAAKSPRFRWYYAAFVGFALLSGAKLFAPPAMPELGRMLPPPEILKASAFMVNSGYYHPECLMAGYPDKRFIGLPAKPEEFERFRSLYPEYRAIVWHEEFSVQDGLLRYLLDSGLYRVTSRWTSDYGIRYMVLEPK